jgi:hypothetical protein
MLAQRGVKSRDSFQIIAPFPFPLDLAPYALFCKEAANNIALWFKRGITGPSLLICRVVTLITKELEYRHNSLGSGLSNTLNRFPTLLVLARGRTG